MRKVSLASWLITLSCFGALFIVYLFGSVGLALWVGRIIPESEGRSLMVNVLLGVIIICIVKHIPIIGFVVGIAFCAASFGIVLLSRSSMKIHTTAS